MDFLESLEKIKEQLIHYESDSTVDTEQLKNQLVALGYERVGQVEMPGQFSVRGGIVDIYCLTEEKIHGESSFGEMRLILSGVLIRRVSVLWKIWKNLRSIRRWSI